MTDVHAALAGLQCDSDRLIDRELHRIDDALSGLWKYGRNSVVAWRPYPRGVALLVVPTYQFLENADRHRRLLHGNRLMGERTFIAMSELLQVEPTILPLGVEVGDGPGEIPWTYVEAIISRYSVTETVHRGVAVLDIVGWSLRSPVEQVAQLKALEYSVHIASDRMRQLGLPVDLGRITTGDGFYIWNRERGLQEDLKLCFALMLILADNAIARRKGSERFVPQLRACFTVGSHYSFYQVESFNRPGYDYIVGDVNIELARLMEKAVPGQILIGDFTRPNDNEGEADLSPVTFMANAQRMLDHLLGIELSGESVTSIRCYLTGTAAPGGGFTVSKYQVVDKHGIAHAAFNAKMNIYRGMAEPIYLGARSAALNQFAGIESFLVLDAPPAPWDCVGG